MQMIGTYHSRSHVVWAGVQVVVYAVAAIPRLLTPTLLSLLDLLKTLASHLTPAAGAPAALSLHMIPPCIRLTSTLS